MGTKSRNFEARVFGTMEAYAFACSGWTELTNGVSGWEFGNWSFASYD